VICNFKLVEKTDEIKIRAHRQVSAMNSHLEFSIISTCFQIAAIRLVYFYKAVIEIDDSGESDRLLCGAI
jgi:hypothetical protein